MLLGPNVDHPSVEAWSTERLPFEPKGWKLGFRDDLLVAGDLSLVDHISECEWRLSGELFEVRQTKSRTDPQ